MPLVESESQDLADIQASSLHAQRARVDRSSITHLDADTASISHSLVEQVQSAHTELVSCNARRVTSNVAEVRGGFVARLDTSEASLERSNAALLRAGSVNGEHCFGAVTSSSGSITLSGGAVGIVAGRLVRGERMRTLLVLAPHVEGEVTALLDTWRAILCGVVAGLVFFLLRRLLGRS